MQPVPLKKGGNRVTIGTPATLVVPARVFRVRLTGILFDTDKCFLLPSAMKGIRAFRSLWAARPGTHVLIVGHADRRGSRDHNQKLSQRRAEAVLAFLRDDADAWLAHYAGVSPTKAWDETEDNHMLAHLGYGDVESYQQARGLEADGVAGTKTRRSLIADYMSEDGTTLPDSAVAETHGCGEYHPEVPFVDGVPAGESAPGMTASEAHRRNRRVEIFLFEDAIEPPPVRPCPPPAGCDEHEQWKSRVAESIDLGAELSTLTVAVTDGAGAPVAGADVHLSGVVPSDAPTDAGGVARFADLIPSQYEVFARKVGFQSASTGVEVPSGAEVAAALAIQPENGALEVLVRDADLEGDGAGEPVKGASVTATAADGTTRTGETNATGKAVFGVPPGSYRVGARVSGFEDGSAMAAVEAGRTTTTVVDMERNTHAIALRLCMPDGMPVPGAPYEIKIGSETVRGATDEAGFLLVHVPPSLNAFVVDWRDPADGAADCAKFTREILLDLGDGDEADRRRLSNLGYSGKTLQDQLAAFRAEFGRDASVGEAQLRKEVRDWHDGGERPSPRSEA